MNRINQISKEKPELLVAHAYTRYLGDLSGGQILKKIAQRGMGLQGSEGLAFYEFDKIEKVLNVHSDLNILWREGKISVDTFNDLCEILNEYTDLIEEVA